MKKQLHYLSLLILLSLCGCEVTLHDNYVETEPLPLETPIEIKLDAEQNSSGELLLIEVLHCCFALVIIWFAKQTVHKAVLMSTIIT